MPAPTRISRRRFTATATAGGIGFFAAPLLRASDVATSPNERPVFATIGLRNQGWAITDKTFRFADFAALADVDANVLGVSVE
ncbi:MAG: gfo/Idh/MocA family oxidoreductase, partial [Pirellulales bacterium]|nr:gfo/Idh/MocA family oxidoreductase [Pirellulales bacterium]